MEFADFAAIYIKIIVHSKEILTRKSKILTPHKFVNTFARLYELWKLPGLNLSSHFSDLGS